MRLLGAASEQLAASGSEQCAAYPSSMGCAGLLACAMMHQCEGLRPSAYLPHPHPLAPHSPAATPPCMVPAPQICGHPMEVQQAAGGPGHALLPQDAAQGVVGGLVVRGVVQRFLAKIPSEALRVACLVVCCMV